MINWNPFSKPKKEKTEKPPEKKQETKEEKETTEDKPLAEYHETIYSQTKSKKKQKKKKESDQIIWRDINGIEKKIDKIHIKKAKKPTSKVDRTVDTLIEKTKKENIRKPSNVIYVVSKPQPGQVKGDWAVRGHHKIYSHHRKKENAIKEARKIAKEKDATVMVQNIDGTFGSSFKPKKK